MYVSVTNHPDVGQYDVSSIRACLSGAAGLPPEVQEGFERLTGGKLVVNASTVEATTAMLSVNAGLAKFSGVVQADTLIANSVVSASYTPGAGNIW